MIKDALIRLVDLVYPRMCIICGKYGSFLCSNCYSKVELSRTCLCFYCGRISQRGKICKECKRKAKSKINSINWCGRFDGVLKELIHNYKYDGNKEHSHLLAEIMVQRILLIGSFKSYIVVPVPIHRKKENLRGFNQSEEIARIVSKKLGINGGLALQKVSNTKSQMGLKRENRLANISGSFDCCDIELIKGRKILLVDDVATTGATVNECAGVLKKAGAKCVDVMVIARD